MDLPVVRGSSRLEAYSDALFSIIATVMIVPISHIEIPEDRDLHFELVHNVLPQLVVYVFTFLVIYQTWADHVWLFECICYIDEVVVLLNLALLMVVTFLPFTFTLLGMYLQQALAVNLFCGTIILVSCLQAILVIYVFRNKDALLKSHVRDTDAWKSRRNSMLASVLTPACIAVISMICTSFSSIAAAACLLLILLGNFIRRNLIKLYHMISEKCRRPEFHISIEEESPLHERLLSENLSKERIECFSDGVFAIVATLIILDICEDSIPNRSEVVIVGSLADALAEQSPVFLAYGGTFVTVALLWYVHHTLLYYIRELSKLMSFCNALCLISVGAMPFSFKLTSKYFSNEMLYDETVAIQFNCVTVFFAGFFQTALFVIGLFYEDRLIPAAKYGGRDHPYICMKLVVFPAISIFVYGLSFGRSFEIKTEAFNAMQIGTLGVFLLLQLAIFLSRKFKRGPGISGSDNSPEHGKNFQVETKAEPIATQ